MPSAFSQTWKSKLKVGFDIGANAIVYDLSAYNSLLNQYGFEPGIEYIHTSNVNFTIQYGKFFYKESLAKLPIVYASTSPDRAIELSFSNAQNFLGIESFQWKNHTIDFSIGSQIIHSEFILDHDSDTQYSIADAFETHSGSIYRQKNKTWYLGAGLGYSYKLLDMPHFTVPVSAGLHYYTCIDKNKTKINTIPYLDESFLLFHVKFSIIFKSFL